MRKVGFRARHKEDGKIDFYIGFDGILQDGYTAYPNDYTLEQDTGLKDKNGVKIYEGDIAKDLTGNKGKVYYDEKMACFNIEGFFNSSYDYPTLAFSESTKNIEVIKTQEGEV